MFPKSVLEHLDNCTPELNPDLANGLCVLHLKQVEEYIDSVFESAAVGFPKGMTYNGCRRCTPLEEYREMTRKKSNKCVFDVARSDVYLMEYKFSYKGEPLKSKYLSLPFVSMAGTIYLGGSRFVISPVLSDKVISIGNTGIFLRLLKAKLTVNRVAQHYSCNGLPESVQVVWSEIYNKKPTPGAAKPTVKAQCTLAHYLFCKYGVTETFKKYANCDIVVGDLDITTENYPESEWVICQSKQMKPKGFVNKVFYVPSELKVAIRIEQYTPMVKNLIGGLFYCADLFPDRLKPNLEYLNSQRLWMILLGHLIWSGNVSESKLISDIEDHIASLDEYLDTGTAIKLIEIGYPCNDIYHLFATVIDKMNDWLLTSDDRVNTVYDKELSIIYYICKEITESINKLYFKLKAAQKKPLDVKKIENIMNLNLRTGAIFKITREHGEVTTTSTSGDNMALKITNLLVPQSGSSRVKSKKDRVAISDPAKRLHASLAEVCAAWALPKSEPSGRSRLNLTVKISSTGLVLRNPKFVDLINSVQAKLKRN
jgi:hypothetical protein